MLTREQYFPGQSPEEQIALFIRRHWMAFFPWILVTPFLVAVFLAVVILLWTSVPTDLRIGLIFGGSIYYLLVLFVFLRAWMSYYLDVTIVTERRLIDIEQDGIFARRIAEQSLLRVQDVSARQNGFFQHLLNFGNLYIETAGEQPNFELHNLPRPNEIAQTILNLHDRLINAGGKEINIAVAEGFVGAPNGAGSGVVSHERHPLEELRPYFPEPSLNHPLQPVPKHHSEAKPAPSEGKLHEGEIIHLDNGNK
ncbi:MAG: PH domain-containing protein [Patescibacteria group bacterium]